MPAKIGIARLVADAKKVENVWKVNPTFAIGTVNLEQFQASIAALEGSHATVESQRTTLVGTMNQRDAEAAVLADLVTRARSGVRNMFGPDSSEYEQVGGTRRSDRKPSSRSSEQPDGSQEETTVSKS